MRRLYRNVHIAMIAALLLVAVAFEASAVHGTDLAHERADRVLIHVGPQ
ncbi:hypothetical protein CLV78_11134 [Aliiruegeria haliotis]|uniref:Uncharacterized protein n=1 Tax=Aliiruegeria haliotis TaxID=1280846 RepID=A0A2T0RIF5_9RHOB|nr:hypothetical protein [Aliiruegeria haliotis]PRY20880.1 hypothetical protein CLV78_11134 [Aliiruegeria haliotis]